MTPDGRPNPELLAEFEHQLTARYRDRLPLFASLSAAIVLVAALGALCMLVAYEVGLRIPPAFDRTHVPSWVFFVVGVLAALLAWIIPSVDRRARSSAALTRLSVVLYVLLVFAGWCVLDQGDAVLRPGVTGGVGFALTLVWLVSSFTLASAILPWSLFTAGVAFGLAAAGPVANVAWYMLSQENDAVSASALAAGATAVGVVGAAPGLIVAGYQDHTWRRAVEVGFFSGRYSRIERDLVDARRIHDELFPEPVLDGPVQLRFAYEPMAQIGGDFIYLHQPGVLGARAGGIPARRQHPLSFVLVDVTGHGVAAALTVNRLHGELQRIFGEDPDASPGHVLETLNRYVKLTMSHHSIYPTAVAARIDPEAGTLTYASAGHPPSLLVRRPGGIESIDSTAALLGVVPAGAFEANEIEEMLFPGDRLVAYTDGPSDARDPRGRALRSSGVRDLVSGLVQEPREQFADRIVEEVARHRAGPPQDDTLVVVVGAMWKDADHDRAPTRAFAQPGAR